MYDLGQIKAIPCSDIANMYGISLKQSGNRLWGKLRQEEKSASFSINEKKNLWYDFGMAKGGSCIDLIMEIEGVAKEQAIRILAEEFGIDHEKATGNKWRGLTDSQYKELGIQPERATMNFNFDLNEHTFEQLERWTNKYGMPVKELAEKYPDVYNRMVNKIAMERIHTLRDSYYSKLNMYFESDNNGITKEFLKHTATQDATELIRKIDLLQKAVTTVGLDYSSLKVDLENDFKERKHNIAKNINKEIKPLTDDEKIRDRIVNVYKKLFNYNLAEYFTIEQAKALKDINKVISNTDNKFVSIDAIKKAYKVLGQNLDKLEKDYSQVLKTGETLIKDKKNPEYQKWGENEQILKNELTRIKELFNKCSTVIEGIREVNISVKNDIARQNQQNNNIKKDIDLSQ